VTKADYLIKLGAHIAIKRKAAGLSQSQLALRCDKDQQNIQRLEKGRINPTAFYLREIAQALEIPVKDLLDFE
jgi:putative transcriptional regulator